MLSPSTRIPHTRPAAGWRPWLAHGVGGIVDLLLTWHERARQRRHLRSLDDHMLRDIGLSRADLEVEADKPFWRL